MKKSPGIETLNYCSHAIEDLMVFAATMDDLGARQSAEAVRWIVAMLQKSVKFLLPNCCDLINPDDLGQKHVDLLRLPFPCVAFEAPWVKDDEGPKFVGRFEQKKMTKRIALCWETEAGGQLPSGLIHHLSGFAEGVFFVPIFWGPETRQWMVGMGGSFVPYNNTAKRLALSDLPVATQLANQALIDVGQAKENALQFQAEPFVLLPEAFEMAKMDVGGHDAALSQIILDSHDEAQMLIQACSMLNCANVITVNMEPDAALNKRRQAKGKLPLFTYKVLQLQDEKRVSVGGVGAGGHASPRMHLRRGHLRNANSKVIWVRPTTVNAGSALGSVTKDYALTARRPNSN